jgi:hypothetical protein
MNITLRQHYVGLAMQGLIACDRLVNPEGKPEYRSKSGYEMACLIADSMIALEKETNPVQDDPEIPGASFIKLESQLGSEMVDHSKVIAGERFFLGQDEDTHWYKVPVSQRKYFEQWCELEWEKAGEYAVNMKIDFEAMKVDGPHRMTFTDPVEES